MAILFTVAIVGYQVLSPLFPDLGAATKLFASLFSFLVVVDPLIILRNADVREVLGQLVNEIREYFSRRDSENDTNNE